MSGLPLTDLRTFTGQNKWLFVIISFKLDRFNRFSFCSKMFSKHFSDEKKMAIVWVELDFASGWCSSLFPRVCVCRVYQPLGAEREEDSLVHQVDVFMITWATPEANRSHARRCLGCIHHHYHQCSIYEDGEEEGDSSYSHTSTLFCRILDSLTILL